MTTSESTLTAPAVRTAEPFAHFENPVRQGESHVKLHPHRRTRLRLVAVTGAVLALLAT